MDLSTFDNPVDPQAAARLEERRELFRIAGQSALDRSQGGKDLDPDALAWAKAAKTWTRTRWPGPSTTPPSRH